jgi:hypothetical protein
MKRRAVAFLKEHAGIPYCDECIRIALSVPRTRLNEKGMAENAEEHGFRRDWDVCVSCGHRRITTKA